MGRAEKRPRETRFFIGSASPDEYHKRTLKSVEGETRQDLKIPSVSGG